MIPSHFTQELVQELPSINMSDSGMKRLARVNFYWFGKNTDLEQENKISKECSEYRLKIFQKRGEVKTRGLDILSWNEVLLLVFSVYGEKNILFFKGYYRWSFLLKIYQHQNSFRVEESYEHIWGSP